MRRFLIITDILISVFFLSACENNVGNNDKFPTLEFESMVEIVSDDMKVNAKMIRDNTGNTQIEIISPETLNGLIFKNNELESSISKDELSYKTDDIVLPQSSGIASVIEALNVMDKMRQEKPFYKDDKEMAFIGKIGCGKFELRAERKTGFITEIKIGEKITASFSK